MVWYVGVGVGLEEHGRTLKWCKNLNFMILPKIGGVIRCRICPGLPWKQQKCKCPHGQKTKTDALYATMEYWRLRNHIDLNLPHVYGGKLASCIVVFISHAIKIFDFLPEYLSAASNINWEKNPWEKPKILQNIEFQDSSKIHFLIWVSRLSYHSKVLCPSFEPLKQVLKW